MWCCAAHASWAPWRLSRVRLVSPPGSQPSHAATPAERAQLDRELLVGLRGEVRPIRDLVSRTGDVINYGPHAFSPGHDYMAGLSVDAARVGDELQFHVREA